MKKFAVFFILAALLAPLAASPAKADPGHRRGHWVHGWHGPRYGWWWVAGPSWRYYPNPYYQRVYYPPAYYGSPPYVAPAPVYVAPPAPVLSFGFNFGGGRHHR